MSNWYQVTLPWSEIKWERNALLPIILDCSQLIIGNLIEKEKIWAGIFDEFLICCPSNPNPRKKVSYCFPPGEKIIKKKQQLGLISASLLLVWPNFLFHLSLCTCIWDEFFLRVVETYNLGRWWFESRGFSKCFLPSFITMFIWLMLTTQVDHLLDKLDVDKAPIKKI